MLHSACLFVCICNQFILELNARTFAVASGHNKGFAFSKRIFQGLKLKSDVTVFFFLKDFGEEVLRTENRTDYDAWRQELQSAAQKHFALSDVNGNRNHNNTNHFNGKKLSKGNSHTLYCLIRCILTSKETLKQLTHLKQHKEMCV